MNTIACFAGDNTNDVYDAFTNERNNIRVKFHLGNNVTLILMIVARSRKMMTGFPTLLHSCSFYNSKKSTSILS